MKTTLRLIITGVACVAALCGVSAQPSPVELDFDRLPSEQGWRLEASYQESRVVSLTNGILAFDTSKWGLTAGGYSLPDAFETNAASYAITFRARVIAAPPVESSAYFEVVAVPPGGVVSFFRLSGDQAYLATMVGTSTQEDKRFALAAGEFHDYRLETLRGIGAYLFVDGVLAASSATTNINRLIDNDVSIGVQDHGARSSNIKAELTSFRLSCSATASERPIVTCAADAEVQCSAPVVVRATIADPNGDAMQVIWRVNGSPVAASAIPSSRPLAITRLELPVALPVGTNLVSVQVNDGAPESVYSDATIVVRDVTAPVILEAGASPGELWPPRNQIVTVAADAEVLDDCTPVRWRIQSVACSEPYDPRDVQILDDRTVNLRATRSGRNDGRIYTILLQAADAVGNLSEVKSVSVLVPHDARNR